MSSYRFALLAAALCPFLPAQWNPSLAQWGRTAPTDVRVMTFNVLDALCSTNAKNVATNNWAALARIVAAMQPDVLLLQECGDNSGNGTGTSVDSVANLTATIAMLLHGGADTFHSSTPVTQYVQAFAPGYDLPYVFVSSVTDGYNRNVILSRWPFRDLNGDGRATMSDIPTITADLYAPGGTGGIRGYMTAEIDLPDALYAGDLVVGNCHLKAGGATSDHDQRIAAAQDIAYFHDYFWNGAGGSVPDPRGRIADNPPATMVLDNNTPIVCGGDWNEDEIGNGATRGPTDWIARAALAEGAGSDGPDRDRSDMVWDAAVDPFTGTRWTYPSGPYTDDYICWQDSIAGLRRSFVFQTNTVVASAMPPQLNGFLPAETQASAVCSDHRPVIADLILPAALACSTAFSTDLGFAKLGGNQRFPRFSLCGSLASGQTGVLTLDDAPPNGLVAAGLSGARTLLTGWGGTILLDQPVLLGPFLADANGHVAVSVPGGGGSRLYMQWVLLDPAASFGLGFSNAQQLNFGP